VLYDRIGPRVLVVTGFALLCYNTWQLAHLDENTPLSFVVLLTAIRGVALGLTVQTPFIQPNAAFSIQWSAAASFMVVVGGLGTIEGPILGAAIYVVLQQQLGGNGAVHLIVLGVISVAMMLIEPRGIAGLVRDLHGRLNVKLKQRSETLLVSETYASRFRAM